MHIEHIALWCQDLERMKGFYEKYFGAKANDKYTNSKKQFESYFLTFEQGARIELMHKTNIAQNSNNVYADWVGLAHFAVAVGSDAMVNQLTDRLRSDGYEVVGEPRWTGDGYYESVVLDPEMNRIEVTI